MRARAIQDKAIVITGAASGIGEALALGLSQRGARLLLADIDAESLERVAATVRAQGSVCHTLVTDTGCEASIHALAQQALQLWDGADMVINNAGVGLMAPVDKLQTSDAQWLMNINFWGVVHGCRAFTPQLKVRPDALLVNVSSIFAMVSMPTQSIYNASKAAVRAFSDALREELRPAGIDVLCVHPGGIRTNIANAARITDVSLVADSDQEMRETFTRLARTSPAQAAEVIIRAMQTRKTRVLVGGDAVLLDWIFRLFPAKASHWFSRLGQMLRKRAKSRSRSAP